MFQIVPKTATSSPLSDDVTRAPSDEEVLDALVANNGIIMRVAVKLEISEGDIFRIVARNAKKLSTRLRAATMVQSYATLVKVSAALEASLLEMQPDAVGRTYAASLASFSQLAGQFDEAVEVDTDDDTLAGKQFILNRLESLGKREAEEIAKDGVIEQDRGAVG